MTGLSSTLSKIQSLEITPCSSACVLEKWTFYFLHYPGINFLGWDLSTKDFVGSIFRQYWWARLSKAMNDQFSKWSKRVILCVSCMDDENDRGRPLELVQPTKFLSVLFKNIFWKYQISNILRIYFLQTGHFTGKKEIWFRENKGTLVVEYLWWKCL